MNEGEEEHHQKKVSNPNTPFSVSTFKQGSRQMEHNALDGMKQTEMRPRCSMGVRPEDLFDIDDDLSNDHEAKQTQKVLEKIKIKEK